MRCHQWLVQAPKLMNLQSVVKEFTLRLRSQTDQWGRPPTRSLPSHSSFAVFLRLWLNPLPRGNPPIFTFALMPSHFQCPPQYRGSGRHSEHPCTWRYRVCWTPYPNWNVHQPYRLPVPSLSTFALRSPLLLLR